MDPVIVQCAVTGSQDPRPELPCTPAEIVESALAAWRAGASVLHLHARTDDGTPTQDPAWFEPLVDGLREAGCDAIVNLSTGTAGGRAVRDERYEVLRLRPELASFDCGTINFGERIFEGDLPFLRRMGAAFREHGVVPEVECFGTGHVGLVLQLVEEGVLAAALLLQFVVGVPGSGVPATIEQVQHLRRLVPPEWPWLVAAIGRSQLPLNTYCLLEGGHVRTGLEDNLRYGPGQWATNEQLVARVVRLAGELGREVATPAVARELLGL